MLEDEDEMLLDEFDEEAGDDERLLLVKLKTAEARPNTRVGVYNIREDDVCEFYGYGTYEGDCLFGDTDSKNTYQSIDDKIEAFYLHGRVCSARIRMDDGSILWGIYAKFKPADVIEGMLNDENLKIENCAASKFSSEIENIRREEEELRELLSEVSSHASLFGRDNVLGEA